MKPENRWSLWAFEELDPMKNPSADLNDPLEDVCPDCERPVRKCTCCGNDDRDYEARRDAELFPIFGEHSQEPDL